MRRNRKQPDRKLCTIPPPPRVVLCTHSDCDQGRPPKYVRQWCPDCCLSYHSCGCVHAAKECHLAECQPIVQTPVDPPVDWSPTMLRGERASKTIPPEGLATNSMISFARPAVGTWLLKQPQEDVIGIIIDTYRLRMSDMTALAETTTLRDMYSKARNCDVGLYHFLSAARKEGLLPSWWGDRTDNECQLRLEGLKNRGVLDCIDQDIVIDRYGKDASVPTQMRLLTATIYGSELAEFLALKTLRHTAQN
ncbi:hypothetical protein B0J13DRAFT_287442 [Dactylonectria estremocensis]|uniref:Uncharacterized protein n=1 Tax=Dactylonectria estremocensis TaxID=1079267 RepID=A0A9P9F1Y7_9HYPO|nr:hypothetical protein B0J13DRAFT_287442 [Dactylonectria estremocensis]